MYPPQLASDLESVPIHRSTSDAGHAPVLADAPAGRPHGAQRVRFIDQQQRLVLLLEFHEARQFGEVAIHAVHALDGDQHAAIAVAHFGQQRVERLPVVMGKGATRSAGKLGALDDRVVGQNVVEDQIVRPQQVADGGDVGGMAGDEDDRGRGAQERGQGLLQITMHLLLAGDQPTGAGAGAIAVDRGLGGGGDLRIVGHADVVVDAEVDELAPVDAGCASGSALVDAEIRVVAGHCQQHAFVTLQLGVLGEPGEIVVFGRNLAGGNVGPGAIDQMLLHRLGQIPQRLGLAEHRVGQVAAEGLLQRGHEFQALQRIQAQGGEGCIRCQVGQSCAGQGAGVLADGGKSGLRGVRCGMRRGRPASSVSGRMAALGRHCRPAGRGIRQGP